MGYLRLVCLMGIFMVCSCCGKDFAVLGRHQWRCRKRMPNNVGSTNTRDSMADDDIDQGNEMNGIKCSCFKICKGVNGLKLHQRRCGVIEGLSEDQVAVGNSNIDTESSLDDYTKISADSLEYHNIKTGILLPKRNEEWDLANNYFKLIFADWDFNSYSLDLDAFIQFLNDSIYNYFKATYGTVDTDKDTDKELVIKYKEYSTNSLKKALKRLKMLTSPTSEIRYVSRLLRTKLSNKSSISSPSSAIHNDKQISKNFWGFLNKLLLSHQRSCRPFLVRYVLSTLSECFRPLCLPANLQFPAGFLYWKSRQPLLTLTPRLTRK